MFFCFSCLTNLGRSDPRCSAALSFCVFSFLLSCSCLCFEVVPHPSFFFFYFYFPSSSSSSIIHHPSSIIHHYCSSLESQVPVPCVEFVVINNWSYTVTHPFVTLEECHLSCSRCFPGAFVCELQGAASPKLLSHPPAPPPPSFLFRLRGSCAATGFGPDRHDKPDGAAVVRSVDIGGGPCGHAFHHGVTGA